MYTNLKSCASNKVLKREIENKAEEKDRNLRVREIVWGINGGAGAGGGCGPLSPGMDRVSVAGSCEGDRE